MLHDLEDLWPRLYALSDVDSLVSLLPQFGFEDTMVDRFPYQNETTEKRNLLIRIHLPVLVTPLIAIVMKYAHEEVYDVSSVETLHKFVGTFNSRFRSSIIRLWDVIDDMIIRGSLLFVVLMHEFLEEYKLPGLLYLVQRLRHLANEIKWQLPVFTWQLIRISLCRLNLCPCATRSQNLPCTCGAH